MAANSARSNDIGTTHPALTSQKKLLLMAATILAILGITIVYACTWQICKKFGIPYPCCK